MVPYNIVEGVTKMLGEAKERNTLPVRYHATENERDNRKPSWR